MRYLPLICMLVVGVAFGTETDLGHRGPYPDPTISHISFPYTSEAAVSQPFIFENITNGLGCNASNSWMIADDATPPWMVQFWSWYYWVLYTGSPATTWKLQARNNSGTGPGMTILWTENVTDVMNTSTGLYGWGYLIYTCWATPQSPYGPTPAVKIWLCFQSMNCSGTSYLCAVNQTWADQCYFSQNNGTSWSSSTANWGVAYGSSPDQCANS